ncbi:hypothetical protein FQR65_LT06571 [Abscondita terminalis]|nr:hypothetical protein FQR65_LT06571 [Abscondita terminalis]
MYMFGAVFGFPISVYFLDKIGRLARNVNVLLTARFIAGLSANVNFCALPVYIAEISEKHIRGRLGTLIQVMTLIASSTIGGIIVILQLLTFSFMPESPYYLLIKNDHDGARKSLQKFRGSQNIEDELNEISATIREQYAEPTRLFDLLKIRCNRKVIIIMVILSIAENFSGITVLFMNIHLIFEDIPSSLSTNILAILFSVLMCVGCIVAVFVVDKTGRISLLFSSGIFTGISLIILSSYLVLKQSIDVSSYGWVPVVTMLVYAITYKYGVGLIPLVLASELFSTNIKAAGVALSCFTFIVSGIGSISGLISLSDGMHYAWTSPALPVLMSPSSPVQIEESEIALLENMYMFGAVFGFPISVYFLDKIGRLARNVNVLLTARFIAGLSANVNFCALPVYIAEISEKHIRGRLGTLIQVMTLIASSTIGGIIVILQLLTFSFMPESPYYLLIKNDHDGARKSLQKFRGSQNIEDELNEISATIREQYAEPTRLFDLLKIRCNRKVIIIMVILSIAENFSGITVLFMNIHLIFEDIPSSLSTNILAILFSVLMCVGCIVAVFVVDKTGRISLLFSSGIFTGISLIILSSYLVLKQSIDVSSYGWVPVVTMLVYAITYKYGVGLIPLVLASELFSTNIKAAGVALSCFTFIVSGIGSISIYHSLKDFGLYVPFYLFGSCCVFTSFFALFCIPETKGKSLEEIQNLLNGNVPQKDDYQEIK